jgi:hypothetical protein
MTIRSAQARRPKRLWLAALLLCLALPAHQAEAGPKSEIRDEFWLASEPDSKIKIDHRDWQAILDIYLEVADPFDWSLQIDEAGSRANNRHFATFEIHDQYEVHGKHHGRAENVNRFDYGAMRPEDKQRLEDYLVKLQAIPVSELNRDEQRAFWVNLYNALVVKVILDHYPVDSILDIDLSDDPVRRGPWTARLVTVEGRELSLDNIESNILRPIWHDPRLLYVLSCGAVGCPELGATAMNGDNGEELLEKAAKRFINHPRGAAIREINKRRDSLEGDGRLYVSSLYVWFSEDFGESDRGVIHHIEQYADERLADMLIRASEIDSDGFEWELNDIED